MLVRKKILNAHGRPLLELKGQKELEYTTICYLTILRRLQNYNTERRLLSKLVCWHWNNNPKDDLTLWIGGF